MDIKLNAPRWLRNGLLIATTSFVLGSGAWLAWFAGCLYNRDLVPLCRHPQGGWVVFVLASALIWLWSASYMHERLRKRLRRGMYSYRAPGWHAPGGQWVENVVSLMIDGELPNRRRGGGAVVLYDRTGWWVDTPVDDGTRVWVGRQAMWEWLLDVAASHKRGGSGSAIAQRVWEGRIGRAQWWARCWLLQQVAAAEQTTVDPRSRRLVRTDINRIMEDLEATMGLSEQ